jgi:cytochrome P450/NADPH-cytochrome P450 reductase
VDNDLITITGSKKKFLLADTASVWDFFSSVVELNTPITKRQIDRILQHAKDDKKPSLEKLKGDATYQIYLQKRYSIIDVLDEFDVQIPMNAYVDMLQPLTPRQYSISSSPLYPINTLSADEAKQLVSITYDVFESPAWSGHGTFQGTASTYLASRHPGDRMSCFIRPTNVGFRLPPSPETPVIMIAAGTGLAPMRAFIQERAAIAEAGVRKLGPATLFFGCRHEDKDFIYKEELLEWEKNGIVQVKPAFSKMENKPKYVQDVIWENKDEVADMFKAGGKIYLCGSAARLGKSAAEVCKKIYRERTGAGEKEADEWLERQKEDRYVSDVFG